MNIWFSYMAESDGINIEWIMNFQLKIGNWQWSQWL
jgi:hypothetical protein